MPSLRTIAGFGLLAAYLARRGVPLHPRRHLSERLADLPRQGLPVREPVRIRWNEHQIPFVEAAHDADAAVGLGVVHAHLRLAQIEMMRRAARGRLSEVLGPAALDLDHALRILDLGQAVPGIVRMLPESTRLWLEGFAAGINAVIAQTRRWPEEFERLGFRPSPWTVEDLVALGRLAATDFTWKIWIPLLRLRGRPDWVRLWQAMMSDGAVPVPSFTGAGLPSPDSLLPWLDAFGRHGSNSLAVGRERSATGSALIASDPHLSVVLPNLWLVAGVRSPGYHAVGLMIPGIPAVALGRNPWIAWGGTSLHATSSELFDVTDLPDSEIEERKEVIRVRWWRDVEVTVRHTAYGPIVSDSPLIAAPAGLRLALHWVGHRPSDEFTALLGLNRARDWEGFLDALDGLAVPAQNMTYADAQGRVGLAMAAHLPERPAGAPDDLFVPRAARRHWERFVTARTLPHRIDPASGFVASANNRPDPSPSVTISYFFAPDDRIRRLRALLDGNEPVTLDRLRALQRDVAMPAALELRDRLVDVAERAGLRAAPVGSNRERLFATLAAWDGRYDPDSAGAAAFELMLHHFVRALDGAEDLAIYGASWEPWSLLRRDIAQADPLHLAKALAPALDRAGEALARFPRWGDMHRLRLSHPLAAAPGIGWRYRFADIPWGGGNETVMKAAHGFAGGRHAVRMGANARHISDLSDPDANWFALLGGQDGWIGSTTFLDQFALWRQGAYVRVPLTPDAVRAAFPYTTDLNP